MAAITECLVAVIGDEFLLDIEVTQGTTFSRDLELESIEFVALAERLRQRYGERLDFTSFLAGLTIDEILALTVGAVADYITRSLGDTGDAPDPGGVDKVEPATGAQGG